jgi:hypothetical protein
MVASAVIAGATLIGSSIASSSQRRATNTQTQAANQANQTQTDIYRDQTRRLEPFRQFAMSAMNPLSELMGLDYRQGGARPSNDLAGQYNYNADGMSPEMDGGYNALMPIRFDPRDMSLTPDIQIGPDLRSFGGAPPPQQRGPNNAPMPSQPQQPVSQLDALRQAPGYQFRLQEGINSRDASAASRGLLLSGAQQRAVERFGQDFASNEYGNRIAQLSAVLSGGQYANNALNQAGQNYAGNVSQNTMNAANARASGYQNQANIWNQALGIGAGYLNQSLTGSGGNRFTVDPSVMRAIGGS